MKNIKLLISIIVLALAFSPRLNAGVVNTLELTENENHIIASGTTNNDVYAVVISVYEGTKLINFETAAVNENGEYSYNLEGLKEGVYTVKVADYNGGEYISKTLNLKEATLCLVNFDLGGMGEGIEIECGTKIDRPEDPVKDGHVFMGWFLGDNEYDFNSPVNEEITLDAKWEEIPEGVKEFTFSFYTGTSAVIPSIRVKEGERATRPSNPVKGGYVFVGWFLGENEYTFEEEVYDDVEVYAKWTAKATSEDVVKTNDEAVEKVKESFVEAIVNGSEELEVSEEVRNAIEKALENEVDMSLKINANLIDEDSIDLTDEEMEELISKVVEGDELVGFFDINIDLIIGNDSYEITKVAEEVTITLDTKELIESLPELEKGFKRTFKVIRLHKGKADILDATLNDDNTLKIKTDRFSTYTVIYNDTVDKGTSPLTGDHILTFVILLVVSILGLVTVKFLKKNKD